MSAAAERRKSSTVRARGESRSMLVQCALVGCLLLSSCPRQVAAADDVLTVSVFISGITEEASGFTGVLDGRPFRAATDLAMELVNSNSSLLPGYELQLDYTDAKVGTLAGLCQCRLLSVCVVHIR